MSPTDPAPSSVAAAIGEALRARVDDVAACVRTPAGDPTRSSRPAFERECGETFSHATVSVAEFLDGTFVGIERAGRAASRLLARLAANHQVSLAEMVRHCLRWRDAMLVVTHESISPSGRGAVDFEETTRVLHLVSDTTLVYLCEIFENEMRRVRHELRVRQEQMRYEAVHDALTGLSTRAVVLERAELAMHRARRNHASIGVVFVDLDNFRDVNDTLGHGTGDELLSSVTERLRLAAPEGAVLGRLGGDEFVILVEELAAAGDLLCLAERLLEALREPFTLVGLGDRPFGLTASVGVASDSSGSADELLRNADVAMGRAKWEGKNRVVAFEPAMQWAARSRLELDMELASAHENKEYFLVYQPTFDLGTLRVTGVEALLRWRRPSRGDVLPGEFVPQLERSGLITIVGKWVLETACRQGASWQLEGHEVPISVNVSARQLEDPDFVEHLRFALESSGYPSSALTIEITETAIIQDTEHSARQLARVRDLGVRIAVDDFGTGYSSLTHLQFFPVDSLKIDRSFVSSMLRGREAEALVHTLVQLGGALGIETLAEGIEDLAQLAHLRDERCTSGQGFLFARPLPADEIGPFFASWANGVHRLGAL